MASEMAYRVMRMIARHSEPEKWIESKGFIDYFRMLYGVYGDNLLVDNYSFDRSSMYVKSGVKSGGEHYIALDEKFEYLIVPMIQGVVFMLAAVGAVEVAFVERDAVSCSPFCGLMYWRITELDVSYSESPTDMNIRWRYGRSMILFLMTVIFLSLWLILIHQCAAYLTGLPVRYLQTGMP